MNSAIFRRHTRKSYGGNQNELRQQENILKKLQTNLKWKNVRQLTHNQRKELPQKIANQQKIVNNLRKSPTPPQQSTGFLSSIANSISQATQTVTEAVKRNNSATNSPTLNNSQKQKLKNLANEYRKLSNNLRTLTGGVRRRNTYRNK
jgi:hypothetical protein